MADKKLNDLAQIPSIGSLKNIYVEDANGNQYKVSKESLAEVLGGLIGVASAEKAGLMSANTFTQTMQRRPGDYNMNDFNLPSGLYGIMTNLPSLGNESGVTLGLLIVFNGNGDKLSSGGQPVVQMAVGFKGRELKIRTSWIDIWGDWKQITTT